MILSLAMVAMGVAAFAQKPAAGDKTAEFNLNFQTGGAPVSYGLGSLALPGTPELRLRYFLADDMAARVRFGLGSSSNTASQVATIGGTDITAETKTSSGFGIAITPGIEKHFAGSDKLSPYVGAELPIGFGTSGTVEVSNGDNPAGTPTATGDSYKSETGSRFNLGLGLVLGADYYIADGLYLGVEGGLGLFRLTSTGDGSVNSTTGGVKAPEQKLLGGSSFNLFGATSGALRLGYKF
jgi:Outer membrane protein beta-barrel domain